MESLEIADETIYYCWWNYLLLLMKLPSIADETAYLTDEAS
jgi:hypothetical protein